MRIFHQNENCLLCSLLPSKKRSTGVRMAASRKLSFWWKILILIGHHCSSTIYQIKRGRVKNCKTSAIFTEQLYCFIVVTRLVSHILAPVTPAVPRPPKSHLHRVILFHYFEKNMQFLNSCHMVCMWRGRVGDSPCCLRPSEMKNNPGDCCGRMSHFR